MEYVQKINCLYQPIEVCPQEQEADDIPFGYIYLGANFSQKYVPCKPKWQSQKTLNITASNVDYVVCVFVYIYVCTQFPKIRF